MICTNPLDDQDIIQKACEMKQAGMFVSDIAKRLSKETGLKITQMSLWRMFNNLKEEPLREIAEYEYPSHEDISYLFNRKAQKEKNSTIITYHNVTIRRDLMLRILNRYYKIEFTYNEVKRKCNDREGDENFLAHWQYLLDFHYIEHVDDLKFKFCDRVKKWKTFGQV